MKKTVVILGFCAVLTGCGSQQSGQGFELYDVTPSGAAGPTTTRLEMQGLPAIPRLVVASAPDAAAAAAVQPYAANPGSSVAAVSTEGTWLRVVDDGTSVWLIAEAGQGAAPDASRLLSEATQRSGCIATGKAATVGRSTVLALDCS